MFAPPRYLSFTLPYYLSFLMQINARALWADIEKLRLAKPLVHNLTNYVVMNTTANALLALGASPVMAHAEEELEEFVAMAGAVVINIGTLDAGWIAAYRKAAAYAKQYQKPLVLDPVGAGATRLRTATCLELLGQGGLSLVRGNASEIASLAGTAGATKGVDSTLSSIGMEGHAQALINQYSVTVCISGAEDYVFGAGGIAYELAGGNPMLPLVTGMGCTATALCGAFMAVNPNVAQAAAHAMAVMNLASEQAAQTATGPGNLQAHLFNALHALNAHAIELRYGRMAE